MAFERVSNILKMADRANTSAIGFNCMDYSTAYAVVKVAEELRKPAICMLYPEHVYKNNVYNLRGFAATVKGLAETVSVPIGLHLDHSSDYNFIVEAIRCGFTSVMYDGSMLSLEENIKTTKRVVEIAHLLGVDVEAELGHVGMVEDTEDAKKALYTQPNIAAHFAAETGVDSLAIAIGSAHGFYTETPKLDLERLDEINTLTDVPLVLHGGSGIPDDQLDQAFKRGINKFNVGTEYLALWKNSTKRHSENSKLLAVEVPALVQEDLKNYLRNKMLLTKMSL